MMEQYHAKKDTYESVQVMQGVCLVLHLPAFTFRPNQQTIHLYYNPRLCQNVLFCKHNQSMLNFLNKVVLQYIVPGN